MSDYMLLLRGANTDYQTLSQDERDAILTQYRHWTATLHEQNCLLGAAQLADTGRRLVKQGTHVQVDGPFTETKETIGGYYLIQAPDLQAAIRLAQGCPIFEDGGRIEIRQLAD